MNTRHQMNRHPRNDACMKNAHWIVLCIAALTLSSAKGVLSDRGRSAEAQIKKSDCAECHTLRKASIGPSFHDIAVRYRNDPKARTALIETMKNGGKGNWTEVSHAVPMPPYSGRLADAEIQRIVDWVLKR